MASACFLVDYFPLLPSKKDIVESISPDQDKPLVLLILLFHQ
jgi:hypothetical protein